MMRPEEAWFDEYADDPEYLFARALIELGESIVGALNNVGMTRSYLVRRLGVSKPRMTQILAGDENLTIRTLVSVAKALACDLTVALRDARLGEGERPRADWTAVSHGVGGETASNRQLALAA